MSDTEKEDTVTLDDLRDQAITAMLDTARQVDAAVADAKQDMRLQATTGGSATSPVSGGERPDPTRDLATGGLREPREIRQAIRTAIRRQRELLNGVESARQDFRATHRPNQACDCRGCSRTACAGEKRQHCQRCHRVYDSGRDCGPEFHRRWENTDGIRVSQDQLCSCTDGCHGHQPGYCARLHDGGSKRLCSDCRTCKCRGDCGRGHDPGECQGDMDGSRRQCKNCRQARWRNSNGEAA